MSVVAPPRPPDVDRSAELDPLEALIEEARQRARRRRVRNVTFVVVGIAVAMLIGLVGAATLRDDARGSTGSSANAALPPALRAAEIIVTGYPEAGWEVVSRWTPDGVEELELGGAIVGWSRDGTRLLLVHGYGLDDLDIVGVDGTKIASIPTAHLGDGTGETAVWSPDGSQVAYAAPPGFSTRATERYRRLFVMDADGSNARRLPYFVLGGPPHAGNISWAPDGSRVAFAGRRLVAADRRLGDQVRAPVARSILVLTVGSSQPARRLELPSDMSRPSQPSWSPDGTRMAFTATDPWGRASALYVVRVDGSGLRLIAQGGRDPVWSPDGVRLAYRAGERAWTIRANGTARRALPGSAHGLSWSPDGSMLAYVAQGWGRDVYVVRADGTGRRRILHSDTIAYRYPIWRGGSATLGSN
jgi:Tol biopolymer transport system component